ncbi:hypothetical protein QE152_g40706 [Popillia japonica]|uniref:Uncharacterized protein n=1 Tax=Popillia japonica TaxID=7064 RepID=A0AAW1HFE5_POPJA
MVSNYFKSIALQNTWFRLDATFFIPNKLIVWLSSRLQEAGLQLQPAKCQFAKQSIKYLGHVVSASGIQTDPEKVAAISQISPPKSVKDVRSFLGAASWTVLPSGPNARPFAKPLQPPLYK